MAMRKAFGLLLMSLALAAACDGGGGGDGTDTAGGGPDVLAPADDTVTPGPDVVTPGPDVVTPAGVAQTVSAATGGSVAMPDGSAAVHIPAGALAADTEITIDVQPTAGLPEPSLLGSPVFELGPGGTQFGVPVNIALAFGGTVPQGKTAVLATLEDGAWHVIDGSSLVDGTVVGDVTHFSLFVVYFWDGGGTITPGDEECIDLAFAPCGGDLVGTWAIAAYCLGAPIAVSDDEENPFAQVAGCEDIRREMDVTWSGTFEFAADGTLTSQIDMTMQAAMYFDADCLQGLMAAFQPGVTATSEEVCDGLNTGEGSPFLGMCRFEDPDCACGGPPETKVGEPSVGSWSAEGTNVYGWFGPDPTETTPIPYCVDGAQVVFEVPAMDDEAPEGSVDHLVLARPAVL